MLKEEFVIIKERKKSFLSNKLGAKKNHEKVKNNSLIFNSQVENLYLYLYSWWYVLI